MLEQPHEKLEVVEGYCIPLNVPKKKILTVELRF